MNLQLLSFPTDVFRRKDVDVDDGLVEGGDFTQAVVVVKDVRLESGAVADVPDAEGFAGEHCAVKMVFLGHEDGAFYAPDFVGADAGVVGAVAGVVDGYGIAWDAELCGEVFGHGIRFVVIWVAVVT